MDNETSRRSAEEVATRLLALLGVVGLAHDREQAKRWIVKYGIDKHFSADETAFYLDPTPEQQRVIEFSWRAEAIVPMIWALNGMQEMPALTDQFDVFSNDLIHAALDEPGSFISSAKLRPEDQLEQMEEYLYHQHWRVTDRDLGFNVDQPGPDDPPIEQLASGLVTERRYGMSWICGDGETWDDVPLDT